MPFLNDPSRILNKKSINGGFQTDNSLHGGHVHLEYVKERVNNRIITYVFSADPGFNVKYHNDIVDSILQDKDRWNPLKVTFVPFWSSNANKSGRKADVFIRLSNDKTIKDKCGFEGLSCAILGGHYIYLNEGNWTRGSAQSGLSLDEYRKYVMTHEMCHILGYLHESCSGSGEPASIMLQQTLGMKGCEPYKGDLHFNSVQPPKISTKWD